MSSAMKLSLESRLSVRLLSDPAFVIGAAVLLFWVFCALFGEAITPYSPYADDALNSLAPPSIHHWFGTDEIGRDVFSRVICGARDILTVAPLVTLVATVAGTALGMMAGYFNNWIDVVLSRLFEAIMTIPLIVLALAALTALGSSLATVTTIVAIVFTPMVARTVRATVRRERGIDYVAAARMRGESLWYIMTIEILPNILPVVLVEATLRLGYATLVTATLGFLGFGIQPPSPDWGLSLAENYPLLVGYIWWPVLFDALAIASLVIGTQLVAQSLHRELSA